MSEPTKPKILLVDDEADLLAGLSRTLRSEHFQITTTTSPAAALELLRTSGPFATIVSDLHMPEMDGITLLQRSLACSPDTVRVLFTGQPDMDNTIEAVNKGAIFRFMVKPCSRVVLALTLKAAVAQHRLLTAERVLLEQTLSGSIKALTDVLALTAPMAFGRAARLRQTVRSLAAACGVSEYWHVEVAAMLSQIGCVTLPPVTLEKIYQGEPIDEAEQGMVARMPAFVERVLGNIPRLEAVREILRFQAQPPAGSGSIAGISGCETPTWGARAFKLAHDLDVLESEGMLTSRALQELAAHEGRYDPDILRKLAEIRNAQAQVRQVSLAGLRPGMVLAEDVRTTAGTVFVARGQEVTASVLEKLSNFDASRDQIEDTCLIRSELGETGGPNLETGRIGQPDDTSIRSLAQPAPEDSSLDPVTGSLGREQAESVIRTRCLAEDLFYTLVLVIDRPDIRFGRRVGDELFQAYGEFVGKLLSKDVPLFRWSGSTLVALLPRTHDLDRVTLDLRQLLERNKFEHSIRTSTRSILLPVSWRYSVLTAVNEPAELIQKIDSFVGRLTGPIASWP